MRGTSETFIYSSVTNRVGGDATLRHGAQVELIYYCVPCCCTCFYGSPNIRMRACVRACVRVCVCDVYVRARALWFFPVSIEVQHLRLHTLLVVYFSPFSMVVTLFCFLFFNFIFQHQHQHSDTITTSATTNTATPSPQTPLPTQRHHHHKRHDQHPGSNCCWTTRTVSEWRSDR